MREDIQQTRTYLRTLFDTGLAAVHGTDSVIHHLQAQPLAAPVSVVAIGKAADAMLAGASRQLGTALERALLIQPVDYMSTAAATDARVRVMQGEHPVPGRQSLAAGAGLLQFLQRTPDHHQLLFLFSGGTSSLVEVPVAGVDADMLARCGRWLLGSGLDIGQVNHLRMRLSRIKGGRLAGWLGDRDTCVLLISDVPGDDPAVIGSGLLHVQQPSQEPPAVLPAWWPSPQEPLADTDRLAAVPHHVIAGNAQALDAIGARAGRDGYRVAPADSLPGDVHEAAAAIVGQVQSAAAGIYTWGGETTVRLAGEPGCGGRNQHLALLVACALAGDESFVMLAAGSDGRDGNSDAAGAIVDGGTPGRGCAAGLDIDDCLVRADAGHFLSASGDVLKTGPTATNVMDLVILAKLD